MGHTDVDRWERERDKLPRRGSQPVKRYCGNCQARCNPNLDRDLANKGYCELWQGKREK